MNSCAGSVMAFIQPLPVALALAAAQMPGMGLLIGVGMGVQDGAWGGSGVRADDPPLTLGASGSGWNLHQPRSRQRRISPTALTKNALSVSGYFSCFRQ